MDIKITKDMIISKVLSIAPESVDIFVEYGMHCVGCMAAAGETIEEACEVHGINADELVDALNAAIA